MPINKPAMKSGLQSGFASGATTFAAAASSWASAVQTGTASIVPASTTVSAAAGVLQTALAAAFALPAAIPTMELAFTAFGAAVGLGMLPAFTAVPPAGPVGFAAIFATTTDSHSDAAQSVADAIDDWLKTGTATLVAPPFTTTPWS